jgi:hypothetical protein
MGRSTGTTTYLAECRERREYQQFIPFRGLLLLLDEAAARIELIGHLPELRPPRQLGVHGLYRQGQWLRHGGCMAPVTPKLQFGGNRVRRGILGLSFAAIDWLENLERRSIVRQASSLKTSPKGRVKKRDELGITVPRQCPQA